MFDVGGSSFENTAGNAMKSASDLRGHLQRIDGKGYKAYKGISGCYGFPKYTLLIDHVQGDPFAAPSRVRVRVDREVSNIPEDAIRNKIRTVAAGDFLTREFHKLKAEV